MTREVIDALLSNVSRVGTIMESFEACLHASIHPDKERNGSALLSGDVGIARNQ